MELLLLLVLELLVSQYLRLVFCPQVEQSRVCQYYQERQSDESEPHRLPTDWIDERVDDSCERLGADPCSANDCRIPIHAQFPASTCCFPVVNHEVHVHSHCWDSEIRFTPVRHVRLCTLSDLLQYF